VNQQQKDKKILIIGLGQIGYSNAEYMQSIGINVDGFDISKEAVQRALKNGIIQNEATSFEGYDYYVICVSTHLPTNMFIPYLDGVYELAKRLAIEGKAGALIGIDSTIPRGVSNKIKEIVNHRLHVCHVPHRYYVHEKKDHGVNQTRVLGASDECCRKEAVSFYHDLLGVPLYPVSSIDVAELTKIVENSYRYLEIAFAEELKMMCDKIDIDFAELRQAINTKWNVKILEAQGGIGGHCLPKDSEMVIALGKDFINCSLLETAKQIDRQYRSHIGPEIVEKARAKYMIDQTPQLIKN
jgi:UDP-N-acetyl-D-mannosaminuronic acid dehydrogenase